MPDIDEISAPDGLAAEEHPESHDVAIDQGDFDGPAFLADGDRREDDRADRRVPARGANRSLLDHAGRGVDLDLSAPLPRMDDEPGPGLAAVAENFDVARVERRGAGAGVDLDLDLGDVKLGQSDPFAPSQ